MGMNGLVRKVLAEAGINPERFSLQWASAAEAPRFVKLITDFTGRIREMGPIGESEKLSPKEVQERIAKALEVVNDQKVRMSYGNLTRALRKEGAKLTDETIASAVEEKLSKSIAGALGG